MRVGAQPVSKTAETKNLSSLGVLFVNDTPMAIGEPIEYVITLPSQQTGSEVAIRCLGKVVRHQSVPDHGNNVSATAVTLERYEFMRNQ